MQTANLRPATPADETRVAALLEASGLPLDGVHESFANFILAEDGDALIGVAGLELPDPGGTNAMLRSVAVDASYRGTGQGGRLVEAAIDHARNLGVIDLYLLTTTAESWFPLFGFLPCSRDTVPEDIRATGEFQGACPASAAAMLLPLVGA